MLLLVVVLNLGDALLVAPELNSRRQQSALTKVIILSFELPEQPPCARSFSFSLLELPASSQLMAG